jgi:Na+-exporting ATPase
MGVSFGIGSYIEGGVVAGIIFLNIVIGFMQEYSAEKTMDSLRSLSSPTSSVIRHGESMVIPTIHVVPGDMVELKTGGKLDPSIQVGSVLIVIQIPCQQTSGNMTGPCRSYEY